MDVVHRPTGSPGVTMQAVLPSGTAADTITLRTTPGSVAWEGACGTSTLCGQVAAINNYAVTVTDLTAVIDSISVPTVNAVGAPYVYGTLAAGVTSSPQTFAFSDPTGEDFTFRGHVEGTVASVSTDAGTADAGPPTDGAQVFSTGAYHTCAIRTSGSLWCWGENDNGQIGDGSKTDRPFPTQVGTATDWVLVRAGSANTCAIKTGGTLWCWGYNATSQLGDGTSTERTAPVQIGTAADWRSLALSQDHTCALKTDGSLWCWGWGAGGLLGDGVTTNHVTSAPTRVGAAADWSDLSAYFRSSCAVKGNGSLWCWGGIPGSSAVRYVPTQYGTDVDWARISLGRGHACALKSVGTLWCWGSNYAGQVGDGTQTDRGTPTQVGTASDWDSIYLGGFHTCAGKTDRSLWCWGLNDDGQVREVFRGADTSPQQVGAAGDWMTASGGYYHTCAQKADGALWCFGENAAGQLGLGTTTPQQRRPTQVWSF